MAFDFPHEINGEEKIGAYFLADGIYPGYSYFVKTYPDPLTEKEKHFATTQESVRKDVERAFGVLQARFKIVVNAATKHKLGYLISTWRACVILHNMIIRDEEVKFPEPIAFVVTKA